MTQRNRSVVREGLVLIGVSVAVLLAGTRCGPAISIQPSCPVELAVGETGDLFGQVQNPGSIAYYRWEVFPDTAGRVTSPTAADTTFQALEEGVATLRLTASDGLFQVISECETDITGTVDLAVSLASSVPVSPPDQMITLTCTNVGSVEVLRFEITQASGPDVTLEDAGEGVVDFTPTEAGDYRFRCVGFDAVDAASSPAIADVMVFEVPDNTNTNDNTADNTNDNATNSNDNTTDNTNDNLADNTNDNTL